MQAMEKLMKAMDKAMKRREKSWKIMEKRDALHVMSIVGPE